MAHAMRVGDRVIVDKYLEGLDLRGRTGTVIALRGYCCVLFDTPIKEGHDGLGAGMFSRVPQAVRAGRCRHGYAKELRYIGRRVNVEKLR